MKEKERGKACPEASGKEEGRSVKVRVRTLNVSTMTGEGRKLADMREKLGRYTVVQETRWKGSKARGIRGGFKLFYHGVNGRRNGCAQGGESGNWSKLQCW